MDISSVARQSGVPASTLRYYEERSLIRSVGRNGLQRVFAPDILERLALIALGRAAGTGKGAPAQARAWIVAPRRFILPLNPPGRGTICETPAATT